MKLECSKSQFEALYNLFNQLMYQQQYDIRSSLAHDLLKPIHDKLTKRVNQKFGTKKGWNLTLTPLQAKSYYAFFEGRYLGESWPYEQLLIDKHIQLIEKAYG